MSLQRNRTAHMTPVDLDALDRIVAQMTPRPWAWESITEKSNEFAIGQAWNEKGEPLAGRLPQSEWVEEKVMERRTLVGMNESGHANFADADGIVALVNAYPALRQMARQVETIRALKPRIEKWRNWTSDELAEGANDIFTDLLAALDAAREEPTR